MWMNHVTTMVLMQQTTAVKNHKQLALRSLLRLKCDYHWQLLVVSVTQKHHEAEDYTELVDWQSIDRCSDMECQTGVLRQSLGQGLRIWGLTMNPPHLWGGGIKFVENGYIGC